MGKKVVMGDKTFLLRDILIGRVVCSGENNFIGLGVDFLVEEGYFTVGGNDFSLVEDVLEQLIVK